MELTEKERQTLLKLARDTVASSLKGQEAPAPPEEPEIMRENRGAFVCVKKRGNLRGCIGYIQAVKPLAITISEMAEAAAFQDPRFPPLREEELRDLTFEISILSHLKQITDTGEIEVGTHGLYIVKGPHSGLLLPQVATEYGWDRGAFLEQTCYKAGLPPNAWRDRTTKIFIFSADVFGD
jgi:AmmeMemoRadiSam system protein A